MTKKYFGTDGIRGTVNKGNINGEMFFNNDYPDGMYRKLLDCEQIYLLGWKAKTKFIDGLKYTYDWYLNKYE